MAAILSITDVGGHQGGALGRGHRFDAPTRLVVSDGGVANDDRFEHSRLAFGIERDETHLFGRLVLGERLPHRRHEVSGRVLGLGHVRRPRDATLGHVHALQKRRDHFHQFIHHELSVEPHFEQRVGTHVQQERLVCLSGGVDAEIRERAGR